MSDYSDCSRPESNFDSERENFESDSEVIFEESLRSEMSIGEEHSENLSIAVDESESMQVQMSIGEEEEIQLANDEPKSEMSIDDLASPSKSESNVVPLTLSELPSDILPSNSDILRYYRFKQQLSRTTIGKIECA